MIGAPPFIVLSAFRSHTEINFVESMKTQTAPVDVKMVYICVKYTESIDGSSAWQPSNHHTPLPTIV